MHEKSRTSAAISDDKHFICLPQAKSNFLVVSYAQKHVNSAPALNNPAYPLSTLPLPWQTNSILIIYFNGVPLTIEYLIEVMAYEQRY